MLLARKVLAVLIGAWAFAGLAKIVFDLLLGIDDTALLVIILAAALLGAVGGMAEASGLEPMEPGERRDTILGWGAFVGIIATVVCLLLPMPWGALAATAVGTATIATLARFRGTLERRG